MILSVDTQRSVPTIGRSRNHSDGKRSHWFRTVNSFQPDAIEIEEQSPTRVSRIVLYLVTALICGAAIWSSLATIDEVVTARGKLLTTRSNLVVQPLEASIIREIDVAVGDKVRRGQALAMLDPTFSEADVTQFRTRFDALQAQSSRLEAELYGRQYVASDPANPDDLLQEKLFAQRKTFYDASLRNFDAQIASVQANLEKSRFEQGIAAQRQDTLAAVEAMRATLMSKELGSRLNYLLSKDARLEVEDDLGRARENEVDLDHQLEKIQAERQSFIEDFRRAAFQELVDTVAKRNEANEDLKKAKLRREMTVLTAPVDAIVLDVTHLSVGSVVKEAEAMFLLAPTDTALEAEVNVESRDIADLVVGQEARLKFDAFPFQKFGTGVGRVRVISRDAFSPERQTESTNGGRAPSPYYRVRLDLIDTHLRGSEPAQMIAGMTITGEINVGRRTVMSYFLYPLLRGLDESIREPDRSPKGVPKRDG